MDFVSLFFHYQSSVAETPFKRSDHSFGCTMRYFVLSFYNSAVFYVIAHGILSYLFLIIISNEDDACETVARCNFSYQQNGF